jgi:hypothetical protein
VPSRIGQALAQALALVALALDLQKASAGVQQSAAVCLQLAALLSVRRRLHGPVPLWSSHPIQWSTAWPLLAAAAAAAAAPAAAPAAQTQEATVAQERPRNSPPEYCLPKILPMAPQ